MPPISQHVYFYLFHDNWNNVCKQCCCIGFYVHFPVTEIGILTRCSQLLKTDYMRFSLLNSSVPILRMWRHRSEHRSYTDGLWSLSFKKGPYNHCTFLNNWPKLFFISGSSQSCCPKTYNVITVLLQDVNFKNIHIKHV